MGKRININSVFSQESLESAFRQVKQHQWRSKLEYYTQMTSTSLNRVRTFINNDKPFFVVGVRRDVDIFDLYEDIKSQGGVVTEEEEEILIKLGDEVMAEERAEWKEFLMLYKLGYIPMEGQYLVEDGSFSLGVEMSVLVPMSPNFPGYPNKRTRNAWNLPSDFELLGMDLAKAYNQDSILLKTTDKKVVLRFTDSGIEDIEMDTKIITGSPEELGGNMSRLVRGKGKSRMWWTLEIKQKEMNNIGSSLYTEDEIMILCG